MQIHRRSWPTIGRDRTSQGMIARIGVIGAGHLAGFLAEGLRWDGWDGALLVPDRSNAAPFAARFDAEIAESAQHILDNTDIVIVAVRPAQVERALAGLTWPTGRRLLSVMAGVKIDRLAALAPGARIVRAMPISAATVGASPTPVYPHDPMAVALLSRIGSVIPMKDEAALEIASANAAAYGWYFKLMSRLIAANQAAGLDEGEARLIAVGTMVAAGRVALNAEIAEEDILHTLATPGGITAQGLAILDAAEAFAPWEDAFSAVSDRLKSD